MNNTHDQTEAALLADVEAAAAALEQALRVLREHRLSGDTGPKESPYEKRGFKVFKDGPRGGWVDL